MASYSKYVDRRAPLGPTKLYVTVLAVVEVVKPIYERSNDQLLEDVGRLFGDGWPVGCVVDSEGRPRDARFISGLSFASVEHGVSDAARKQGCDESPVLPPRPRPIYTLSEDEAMIVSDALDLHASYDLIAEAGDTQLIAQCERLAHAIHNEVRRGILAEDIDMVIAALGAYPNHRDEEAFEDRATAKELEDTLIGLREHHFDASECVVPPSWPVQPLRPGQRAKTKMTCGTCDRSWDDAKSTSMTPVPSGRCPFETFHPTKTKRRTKRSAQPRP
jgi:hypothetical protein